MERTLIPFSTDVHLLFLECKQSAWIILIIAIVIGLNLVKTAFYTRWGNCSGRFCNFQNLERGWCSAKILELLGWEFLAGVIGIVSVLGDYRK